MIDDLHFEHTPLNDISGSIRLVRILQDLSCNGDIQCQVRHGTIASTYTCLSYVWGPADKGAWVLLNGHRFWIRGNLWAFLRAAQQKPHVCSEWLWIDAITIDQTNTSERNRQVQQMGQIFQSASRVISWLGADEILESHMNHIQRLGHAHEGRYRGNDGLDCEYWQRAWITQEFTLARRITLMAGSADVDVDAVPAPAGKLEFQMSQFDRANAIRSAYKDRPDGLKGKRLASLLLQLMSKRCFLPRDRIFSMLALCRDVKDVQVDYDSSSQVLAAHIIRQTRASICLCSSRVVDRALDIQNCSIDVTIASTPFVSLRFALRPHVDEDGENPPIPVLRFDTVGNSPVNSLLIPFSQICELYSGVLTIHLPNTSGRCFNSVTHKIRYTYNHVDWPWLIDTDTEGPQPLHGSTIELSSNLDRCTVSLSLDMYLILSRVPQDRESQLTMKRCCARALPEMWMPYPPLAESILQLCPDELKVSPQRS